MLDVWLTKPFSELENIKESDIDIGVHSAYLCYKNLSRCETIYLYSEQSSEWAESHHFGYIESLDYIKEIVESKYDKKYSAAFLPNASDIMITMKET